MTPLPSLSGFLRILRDILIVLLFLAFLTGALASPLTDMEETSRMIYEDQQKLVEIQWKQLQVSILTCESTAKTKAAVEKCRVLP